MVAAHAQFAAYGAPAVAAARTGLVEPVFAGDVVGDELVGTEARSRQRVLGMLAGLTGEMAGSEESLKTVFFLAVEIDLELLGIGGGAEVGTAVVGDELIVVDGDIAKDADAPFVVEAVGHEGLVIEIARVVLTLLVHRTQQ